MPGSVGVGSLSAIRRACVKNDSHACLRRIESLSIPSELSLPILFPPSCHLLPPRRGCGDSTATFAYTIRSAYVINPARYSAFRDSFASDAVAASETPRMDGYHFITTSVLSGQTKVIILGDSYAGCRLLTHRREEAGRASSTKERAMLILLAS